MQMYLALFSLCFAIITWTSFTFATRGQDSDNDLGRELQEMKKHMSAVTAAVDKLLEESKGKDSKIKDLEQRVSDLENGCTSKSEHKKETQQPMKASSTDNNSLELRAEYNGTNKSIIQSDEVNQTLLTYENRILKRVPELSPKKIAFHASLSTAFAPQTGLIIKFDNETLDTVNAYDKTDGTFVAPENGIYVLTWTTAVDRHSWATTGLVINGLVQGVTLADSEEVGDGHVVTGIDVVYLEQGKHAHIEFVTYANKGTLLNPALGRCMFSGWKLD